MCVCKARRHNECTQREKRRKRRKRGFFLFFFNSLATNCGYLFFPQEEPSRAELRQCVRAITIHRPSIPPTPGEQQNTKKKKKKKKKKRFFSFPYFIIIIFNIRQPNKEDHNKQGPWTVDGQRGTTQDGTPFSVFYFTRSLSHSLSSLRACSSSSSSSSSMCMWFKVDRVMTDVINHVEMLNWIFFSLAPSTYLIGTKRKLTTPHFHRVCECALFLWVHYLIS